MFDDLLLAYVTRKHLYTFPASVMEDSISSNSSRETTPRCEDIYNSPTRIYSRPSIAITELSQHFDRHCITPRRPNMVREGSMTTMPKARNHAPPLHSVSSFSNRAHRQRQSLQRSSSNLSHISALVENMVQSGFSPYDARHHTSVLHDSSTPPSLSPDEQQSSAESYFGFTPLPSAPSVSASSIGGYGSAQHSLRHSRSYKIDKEVRHAASRDGIGGQRMVQKKVRMRKSEKNLGKAIGKRRE